MQRSTLVHLTVIFVLIISSTCFAQGRIVVFPRPPEDFPPRYNPVSTKSMYVDVDIQRQVANTTIEQVFTNSANRDFEGWYLFPIPENASISRFTMWMNGEEVEGEIVEARKARRIYEDIVRQARDPGLLEYVGQGLFRARVYPVPARGDVKVRIVYEEILKYDAGLVEYRHPLKAACSRTNRIPDLSMSVEIESDVAIKSLYSPTHEIDTDIRGRDARCGFEQRGAVLDHDFVLYYTVSTEDVGLNLLSHRDRRGDGYFMMLLAPGEIADPDKIIAKDIVFVLDKSGSMQGNKIEQAKRALAYCINSLNRSDRFNIITFSTGVTTYADDLVEVTKSEKKEALDFVENITARGGTDINAALLAALDMRRSKRPRMIIFLTDGLPTVGETDIQEILHNLRKRNDSVRIFPFGVGFDVNTTLLDQMGVDHRGAVEYVAPVEDIEVKVSRFYDKVSNPVLSDIDIDVDGIEIYDIFPQRLPDIFNGTQLVVLGRYDGNGSVPITLSGRVGDSSRRLEYEGTFRRRGRGFSFIPKLWANRKIAYLLSEIKLNGSSRELVDEVIELSLEHGIITPYTSYLILEEGTDDDRRHLSRAAPAPSGADGVGMWSGVTKRSEKHVMALRSTIVGGKTDASGQGAVGLSKDLAEAREQAVLSRDESGQVRYAGGKRFVLRDDVWVDEEFEDKMDVVEIGFLSDEYFELLHNHPDVKEFLALGENVTFVFNARAYRVAK